MKRFVICLRCEQCKREVEYPTIVEDNVVDANIDMECCEVWMIHVNKRVENITEKGA